MKKGTKIALLIALIMIAVGATICNIARGRGESLGALVANGGLTVSSGAHSLGGQQGYTVCLSGEERFAAAEVRVLDLDWLSGSVRVEPYDGKEILLREESTRELTEGQRMRWKLSNGRLSVVFCANGEHSLPEKALTVLLPRDYAAGEIVTDATSASVSLSALRANGKIAVETTSGDILLESCAAREAKIDSSSGEVRVEASAMSGKIDIDTTSGAVTLLACACAELDVDTTSGALRAETTAVSGEINVETASGSVVLTGLPEGCRANVDTTSGDVALRYDEKPGEIEVETTSGDVTLSVPQGTELDMDFDSDSGDFSGELHFTPNGVKVRVETASGDLKIEGN